MKKGNGKEELHLTTQRITGAGINNLKWRNIMNKAKTETKDLAASPVDALVSVRKALEAECERFKVLQSEAATEIVETFYEGMAQGYQNAIVHLIHAETPKDGCTCQGCVCSYTIDLIVPDDIWEQIKPEGKDVGAGLLCSNCILEAIAGLKGYSRFDLINSELAGAH